MTSTQIQDRDKVQTFFDTHVADYDAFYEQPSAFGRWFNRVFRKAIQLRRDEVVTLAKEYDCKTLLDVGCGSGRNTVFWAHHGLERLHGVDISSPMIDKANDVAKQLKLEDRCTFELADFMELQPNEKYDMVVACGVFDYVVDGEALLRQMSRFANKIIYGSFPKWTLVRSPLRRLRYTLRRCPTHFYWWRELTEIFDAVGFGTMGVRRLGGGYLAWSVKE